MVSSEEVIGAFRLLLGREPENETIVEHYAAHARDLQELRGLFLNSAEFREKIDALLGPRPPRAPFNGPPMLVELNANSEQMAALFATVAAQWQHLGETEPHWSVLTNDSYFQKNFAQNREVFYASGDAEFEMFIATLERAGVSLTGLHRCVELGCGVGRMTMPLAGRFLEVQGLDISAAHLLVAKAHAESIGIKNIVWTQLRAVDDLAEFPMFDVLYSRIVLQHNPPPVAAQLLRYLLRKLRPGGVAFFQVPTYRAGYSFVIADCFSRDNRTNMEMHYLPQAALFSLLAEADCEVLEVREDDATGISVTTVSNSLLVRKMHA